MDLYKVLGVEINADSNTIKKAFRSKLKIHHPDTKVSEAEDLVDSIKPNSKNYTYTLLDIINAYDILSNPIKRRHYDLNASYALNSEENTIFSNINTSKKSKNFDYEKFLLQRQHNWDYKLKLFIYDLMMKDGQRSILIYEQIVTNNQKAKLKNTLGYYDFIDCMFLLAESYIKKLGTYNNEKALHLFYEIGQLEIQKNYFGIFMEEIADQILNILSIDQEISRALSDKLLRSMKTWKLKKKYTNKISKFLTMVNNDM